MLNDNDEVSQAIGAVLVDARRNVLLPERTIVSEGCAWTLPQGVSQLREHPHAAVVRQVKAQTGWNAEILAEIPGTFKGTTSSAKFYLAGRVGRPAEPDAETTATRWFSFEEAASYIRQSPNALGRERDLMILRAAEEVLGGLDHSSRPSTCEDDWKIEPIPSDQTEYAIDKAYSDRDMARIRKGFLPTDMDEKWFIWFGGGVLHFHRSWTGYCIFQVSFIELAGGWAATSVVANRWQEQYSETDERAEVELIDQLIRYHLTPDRYGYD